MNFELSFVIIHGIGVEGRHAISYFLGKGIQVMAVDIPDTCPALEDIYLTNPNFTYFSENNFLRKLHSFSPEHTPYYYLRSPGIPPTNRLYQAMIEQGHTVTTPTGYWLSQQRDNIIITITGTKGKSTTTDLTAKLIRVCGHTASVFGNIGAPPLGEILPERAIALVELSSFMLHDLPPCTHYHVITNLFKEHIDWHGSFTAYKDAKTTPLERGTPSLISNKVATQLKPIDRYKNLSLIEDSVAQQDDTLIIGSYKIIPCQFNTRFSAPSDLAALKTAIAICRHFLKIDDQGIYTSLIENLPSWQGLEYRQQIIPTTDGVTWVNDALATVPEATLTALKRWPRQRMHLLLGGKDRGQDLSALLAYCQKRGNIELYIFGALCKKDLFKTVPLPYDFLPTLEEAVHAARNAANTGDIILFSPSAPSAPPHSSYRQRAKIFSSFAPV